MQENDGYGPIVALYQAVAEFERLIAAGYGLVLVTPEYMAAVKEAQREAQAAQAIH